MAFDFTNKFVTDMQEGHRPRKKITRGVQLDNIGQYQTILCNAGQYQDILNNIFFICLFYNSTPLSKM